MIVWREELLELRTNLADDKGMAAVLRGPVWLNFQVPALPGRFDVRNGGLARGLNNGFGTAWILKKKKSEGTSTHNPPPPHPSGPCPRNNYS